MTNNAFIIRLDLNKWYLALLCSMLFRLSTAQDNSFQEYYYQARDFYKKGNYPQFYEKILQAHKIHPYHQGILYHAGIAASLNQRTEEAINFLRQAVEIKADYDLELPEFNGLSDNEDFKKLKQLQSHLLEPVLQSDLAFVLSDKSLHIESIATGEDAHTFYLGSIHKRKIIKFQDGKPTDFTEPGQDGLTSVFGIKVDNKKNILWACASPMAEMENFDAALRSALFGYDLTSGKLIQKYFVPDSIKNSVFGDLTLDIQGNVYVSDSKNNIIFIIDENGKALIPFFTSPEFWNIQGITFSADGKDLYIADYVKGLFRLSMGDKKLSKLGVEFTASTKSIDGLTFYKNRLIAVQNGIYPMRVTQYYLDRKGEKLTAYKIIDSGHPAFNEPTIGCVSNSRFYYVANSQWSAYDDQHQLKADQLKEIVILTADLNKIR